MNKYYDERVFHLLGCTGVWTLGPPEMFTGHSRPPSGRDAHLFDILAGRKKDGFTNSIKHNLVQGLLKKVFMFLKCVCCENSLESMQRAQTDAPVTWHQAEDKTAQTSQDYTMYKSKV
jgi:hypothetical protein